MSLPTYSEKLTLLGARHIPWCLEPSVALVETFEHAFGARLPEDYRRFLASHGGIFVDACYPFKTPTPFGQIGSLDRFYGFVRLAPGQLSKGGDVQEATELIGGAPRMVAIGDDSAGGMLWLKCSDDNAGTVYYHDPGHRWRWSDDRFYQYSDLAPEIEEYLELRRVNRLPRPRPGYDNCYPIADSFSEFLDVLKAQQG